MRDWRHNNNFVDTLFWISRGGGAYDVHIYLKFIPSCYIRSRRLCGRYGWLWDVTLTRYS